MTSASPADQSETLAKMRRWLLATVLGGTLGMEAELLLVGHFEEWLQLTPVALLAAGAVALGWHLAAPTRDSVRIVRLVMALFVASGVAGVALHFRGNVEFELEMYPTMAGWELIGKTLTGATPVLAPGSMALLGLVGITQTYGHPAQDADAPGMNRRAS
jgi:hypothetical protein